MPTKPQMGVTAMHGFKAVRPLDKDRLAMTPRTEATRVAFTAMDAVSKESPERMVLGVAALFAAVCRRTGLDPAYVYAMATKVLDAPSEGDAATDNTVQVMRDFVGGRVMGEEVTIS